VVADDDQGFQAAAQALKTLAEKDPGPDPFYLARESIRWEWSPCDVARFKASTGISLPRPAYAVAENDTIIKGNLAVPEPAERMFGPHIFSLDASRGGVAVATTSLVRPVALVLAAGKVVFTAGGGSRVWPRDIAVSADGRSLAAGFALEGTTAAYGEGGTELWSTPSGIVYKIPGPDDDINTRQRNLLGWETHKDSERFLSVSPDHGRVAVSANGSFELRDIASGSILWTIKSPPTGHARGAPFAQSAWSADGSCVLVYELSRRPPTSQNERREQEKTAAMAKIEKEIRKSDVTQLVDGPPQIDKEPLPAEPSSASSERQNPQSDGDEDMMVSAVLVDAASGRPLWKSPHNTYDWELYAAVGPRGKWTITCARGCRFAIRDDKGAILRIVEPFHLPADVVTGHALLTPIFLTGEPENLFVLAKPETCSLYVFELSIGTPAERAAALVIEEKNRQALAIVDAEWKDAKKYGQWDDKYVQEFVDNLEASERAKTIVADKMKRMAAERRAGRKRNYNWLKPALDDFKKALCEEGRSISEKALSLKVRRHIALPAMLCDAKTDIALKTAYVGLWDGTIRAYDLGSGREMWRALVIGGCQIAVADPKEASTIYAGGSRGDLYRFDAKTGKQEWMLNLIEACCAIGR